ncbi:hypothetical protein Tco_1035729 [Tanacetum coccineum]
MGERASSTIPKWNIEPDQGGLTSVVISDNSNDFLLEIPEFESFHFNPSFPRPPPKPPDVEISLVIETDVPEINDFDKLNGDECFDQGEGEINFEADDSFTFVTWTFSHPFLISPTLRFLPYFPPPKMRIPFLTPASSLKAGSISSGWNFHML